MFPSGRKMQSIPERNEKKNFFLYQACLRLDIMVLGTMEFVKSMLCESDVSQLIKILIV